MARRLGLVTEALTVLASTTLAGIACCGPVVLQWLGLLLWSLGGRMLLVELTRFEVPILLIITATAAVSRQLAMDRPTRWANALLAGVALAFAALRLTWDWHQGLVMAVGPILTVFAYRQTVLLAAGGLVFAARGSVLLASLWRLRSGHGRACVAASARATGMEIKR